jgi:Mg2+ and Co2+ transporter CorA
MATLQTCFWAIEAYKMFEDALVETINTWEHFKDGPLDRVNDGRDNEAYEKSVEHIELSIDRLRDKVSWIKKKTEQVHRMREGLSFVAAMCDTRATLSLNKNIKLLTCIGIIFLPISLSAVSCASYFELIGTM